MPNSVPVQGRGFAIFDPRNPTLLPNFDRSIVSNLGGTSGGTLDHVSPAEFLVSNPRVDATVTATVGGTITNLDVITLTFSSGLFGPEGMTGGADPSNSFTVTFGVVTADTTTTIAEGLASAINASAVAAGYGVYATLTGTGAATQVVIRQSGPAGNLTTVSAAVSGGNTETITFGNAGVMAGGSGPIIASNNFEFTYNGVIMAFFYGQPYTLGFDLVTVMAAQGMPIV